MPKQIPTEEFIRLRVLRKARDKASAVYKSLNERHRDQLEKLYEAMTEGDEEDQVGTTTVGGTMFVPYQKLRAWITDEQAFLNWAREQDETFYEEHTVTPREKLLNAEVKRRLDDDEPLPPGVDFSQTPQISQRKA